MSSDLKESFSIEIDPVAVAAEELNSLTSATRGKSSVNTAVLNAINSTIGGGILGLPIAMYSAGIYLGLATQFITLIFGIYSTGLLIKWK